MSSPADLAAAAQHAGIQPSPQHSPRGSLSVDPFAEIAALRAQVQQLVAHAQQQHAQQQAAAVPAPVALGGSLGLKIRNPSMFKGEMGFVVDDWIHEMGQQFLFYGANKFPTDDHKIRFALAYLTGPAIHWWNNEPKKEEIATWAAFVARLHARFRPVQAAMIARQRLDMLKQRPGQSVNSYANAFQSTLTPIADMSNADQVHHFVNGLVGPIAGKVWEKYLTLTDLRAAIDAAVSVEAMGNYGRGASSSNSAFKGRAPYAPRSASEQTAMDLSNVDLGGDPEDDSPEASGAVPRPSAGPTGSDALLASMLSQMQLLQHQVSALAGGRPSDSRSRDRLPDSSFKPGEIAELMKEGRCFRCKQKGHMKSECPKKPKKE
jgi:hypothetical protein